MIFTIHITSVWMVNGCPPDGCQERQPPLCKWAERRSGAEASADCTEVRLRWKVIARPHTLTFAWPPPAARHPDLRVAVTHRADQVDRQPQSVLRTAITARHLWGQSVIRS